MKKCGRYLAGVFFAGVLLLVLAVQVKAQITRPYCCDGNPADPQCDQSKTCSTNGSVMTISAGMGLFDSSCNYVEVDSGSTGLRVLEARVREYDAQGNVIENEFGEKGSWLISSDLSYCEKPDNVGVDCETEAGGFTCVSNDAANTVTCTLDLEKRVCWRRKDVNDQGNDQCIGEWEPNPNTRMIKVNLVYDDINRQMCCENEEEPTTSLYCYQCECEMAVAPTNPPPTDVPPTNPPPTNPPPTATPTPDPEVATLRFRFEPEGMVSPPATLGVVARLVQGEQALPFSVNASHVGGGKYEGQIEDIEPGTFDLYVKPGRHLSEKVAGLVLDEGENVYDLSQASYQTYFLTGDVSGANGLPNNRIDIYDIARIQSDLDEKGPSANLRADVDYDGEVTVYDMAYVVSNFDRVGEE